MLTTASSSSRHPFFQNNLLICYCTGFLIFWIASFIGTADLVNWYIENILVVIFVVSMAFTYRRSPFSNLSYTFIFLFMLLHTYGAKYAYADNPLGFWIQNHYHLQRNPYDRIVHFSFGLLMAYPLRDLFLNKLKASNTAAWLLPVELIISLSCLFELVEWSIADVFFPAHGKNYVGTQGDVWDAQKDMFAATCGALLITAMALGLKKYLGSLKSGKKQAGEQLARAEC